MFIDIRLHCKNSNMIIQDQCQN